MDKRTRLYAQLLATSKEQRETNVVEHKLRTGRFKRSVRARRKLKETNKEAKLAKVPLDFLAIGDSWFEYPLYNEVLSFHLIVSGPKSLSMKRHANYSGRCPLSGVKRTREGSGSMSASDPNVWSGRA